MVLCEIFNVWVMCWMEWFCWVRILIFMVCFWVNIDGFEKVVKLVQVDQFYFVGVGQFYIVVNMELLKILLFQFQVCDDCIEIDCFVVVLKGVVFVEQDVLLCCR